MRAGTRQAVATGPSDDALVDLVRAHADEVHDAVRRTGCAPAAAVGAVEASALELVAHAAEQPAPLPELLGTWFARARERAAERPGRHRRREQATFDGGQELLNGVLDRLDERPRLALLLRDAYDLEPRTLAAALGTDPSSAMRQVGAARLAVLPELYDGPVPSLGEHEVDEAALARLVGGGELLDGGTARHVRSCATCLPVYQAQEDVRSALARLRVAPLPEAAREALLRRVTARARAVLPTPGAPTAPGRPRRLLAPLPVLAAVLLSVALGVALGVLLSRPRQVTPALVRALPQVTAPPPLAVPAPELSDEAVAPPPLPTTTVFTLSPSPAPPPPSRTTAPTTPPAPAAPSTPPRPSGGPLPTASPTAAPPASPGLALDPAAGPAGTSVLVTGTGWPPGTGVVVELLDPQRQIAGVPRTSVTDSTGRFTARIPAARPGSPAGTYRVRATGGDLGASAPYELR